jgi:hypothetical protein
VPHLDLSTISYQLHEVFFIINGVSLGTFSSLFLPRILVFLVTQLIAGICSIARYGSISPHHIQDNATSPSLFLGTSPCHAPLRIPGSLSCSCRKKCGSVCRESSVGGRGNPGNDSRIAPALFSVVHTAFCGDNSCRSIGSRRGTSSKTLPLQVVLHHQVAGTQGAVHPARSDQVFIHSFHNNDIKDLSQRKPYQ